MKFYGDIIIIEHSDPLKPFHRSTDAPKKDSIQNKSEIFIQYNIHSKTNLTYSMNIIHSKNIHSKTKIIFHSSKILIQKIAVPSKATHGCCHVITNKSE